MLKDLMKLLDRRGYIFRSAELYGGSSGFYDYGPLGFKLKQNLINLWREKLMSDFKIYEIETSTILPESVLKASGHVDHFVDPLIECKQCNNRFRADHIIEENLGINAEGFSLEELDSKIHGADLRCPKCGGKLGESKWFKLMFELNVGATTGNTAYLRPETAQGIFINFLNVVRSMRPKLPFGIAQVGRSYRNEISPRQGLIRMREFNQMEIEFFFDPEEEIRLEKLNGKIRIKTRDDQKTNSEPSEYNFEETCEITLNKYMAYFMFKEAELMDVIGVPRDKWWFRHVTPEETPHYSGGNFDLEVQFDFGVKEIVGNAYRTDYDLKNHSRHSGVNLRMQTDGKMVVPHVVEPSIGLERLFFTTLYFAYRKEGKEWEWLDLPEKIVPEKYAVMPLIKKDANQVRIAREIEKRLNAWYDESGSIGKRYARMDEAGVRWCITVDHQTVEDGTVTIRDRNTGKQERKKWELLK